MRTRCVMRSQRLNASKILLRVFIAHVLMRIRWSPRPMTFYKIRVCPILDALISQQAWGKPWGGRPSRCSEPRATEVFEWPIGFVMPSRKGGKPLYIGECPSDSALWNLRHNLRLVTFPYVRTCLFFYVVWQTLRKCIGRHSMLI